MYSDTHNIADLTNEELYRMRDYGKFEYDREAAAAELARREAAQPEAQHAPAALGVQGEYDALTAARRVAVNVAAERDRLAAENERLRKANDEQARSFLATMDGWDAATKLARERGAKHIEALREVERLRDLLAQIIAIAEDALVMAKDRYAETSYARRLEAIKAAKGATK